MKISQILASSKIFLDTSPLIYWIEDHPSYVPVIEPIFHSIHQGRNAAISSFLTLLEILVRPMQLKRRDLVFKYKEFILHDSNLTLVNLEAEACESAAFLKAKYGLKTPDAVQLGIAHAQKADLFLTNDHQLKKIREVRVVLLKDCLNKTIQDTHLINF